MALFSSSPNAICSAPSPPPPLTSHTPPPTHPPPPLRCRPPCLHTRLHTRRGEIQLLVRRPPARALPPCVRLRLAAVHDEPEHDGNKACHVIRRHSRHTPMPGHCVIAPLIEHAPAAAAGAPLDQGEGDVGEGDDEGEGCVPRERRRGRGGRRGGRRRGRRRGRRLVQCSISLLEYYSKATARPLQRYLHTHVAHYTQHAQRTAHSVYTHSPSLSLSLSLLSRFSSNVQRRRTVPLLRPAREHRRDEKVEGGGDQDVDKDHDEGIRGAASVQRGRRRLREKAL